MSIKFLRELTNYKASLSLSEQIENGLNLLSNNKIFNSISDLSIEDIILQSQDSILTPSQTLLNEESENERNGIKSSLFSEKQKKVLKLKKTLQECITREPLSIKLEKQQIRCSSDDSRSSKGLVVFWRGEQALKQMKKIVSLF